MFSFAKYFIDPRISNVYENRTFSHLYLQSYELNQHLFNSLLKPLLFNVNFLLKLFPRKEIKDLIWIPLIFNLQSNS